MPPSRPLPSTDLPAGEVVKAGPIAGRPGLYLDATTHRWTAIPEPPDPDDRLQEFRDEMREESARRRNAVLEGLDEGTIEFEHENPKQAGSHAVLVRDASTPGAWRYSMYDRHGFYSHETHPTRQEAHEAMAEAGFTKPAKGSLDRFAAGDDWSRGVRYQTLRLMLDRHRNKSTPHMVAAHTIESRFHDGGGTQEAFDATTHPDVRAAFERGEVHPSMVKKESAP